MAQIGNAEQEILRNLVRRVDKNLTYQLRPSDDPDFVVLSLRQGKVSGEVQLRVAAIHESEESLANREGLRMRIKRARDAMWASVGQVPFTNNRVQRSMPADGSSYFRTNTGFRGRR